MKQPKNKKLFVGENQEEHEAEILRIRKLIQERRRAAGKDFQPPLRSLRVRIQDSKKAQAEKEEIFTRDIEFLVGWHKERGLSPKSEVFTARFMTEEEMESEGKRLKEKLLEQCQTFQEEEMASLIEIKVKSLELDCMDMVRDQLLSSMELYEEEFEGKALQEKELKSLKKDDDRKRSERKCLEVRDLVKIVTTGFSGLALGGIGYAISSNIPAAGDVRIATMAFCTTIFSTFGLGLGFVVGEEIVNAEIPMNLRVTEPERNIRQV